MLKFRSDSNPRPLDRQSIDINTELTHPTKLSEILCLFKYVDANCIFKYVDANITRREEQETTVGRTRSAPDCIAATRSNVHNPAFVINAQFSPMNK